MATLSSLFLSGLATTNDYRRSDFCVIRDAGELLGQIDAIRDKLATERDVTGAIDPQLCLELLEHVSDELRDTIDSAESQAEEIMADNAQADELREQLRDVERELDCLRTDIGNLQNCSIEDLSCDIAACESAADDIWRSIDV